jgi:hypothetical protein
MNNGNEFFTGVFRLRKQNIEMKKVTGRQNGKQSHKSVAEKRRKHRKNTLK